MLGYICFYNGKRIEIRAENLFAAKTAAIQAFKAPKSKTHMISVVLAEREDGSTVAHSGAEF